MTSTNARPSRLRRFARAVPLALLLAPLSAARAGPDDFPRWGSIGKDKANMHVGPGTQYRLNWIYVRKGLPVRVLREMTGWWLVEDPDGAKGWIRSAFVGKTHTALVKGAAPAELRETPDGGGRLLRRLAPGVIGKLGACAAGWCKIEVDGVGGYVADGAVWGAGEP